MRSLCSIRVGKGGGLRTLEEWGRREKGGVILLWRWGVLSTDMKGYDVDCLSLDLW